MVYSGAWEKLIHEKNQKSQISWHCPFKWDWNHLLVLRLFPQVLNQPKKISLVELFDSIWNWPFKYLLKKVTQS